MTFRDPPLTVDQLQTLEHEFSSQFSSLKAFVDSWQACKDWCQEKHVPITDEGARRWFERDLQRDSVLSYRFDRADDMLAAAHPQEYEPPDWIEQRGIERGDLHDWSELEPVRHAARCVRCQIGVQSGERNAEKARAAGKTPLTLGNVLRKLYGDRRVRCEECGEWDDEPASDACQRSFWHLSDIWLTLHTGSTLADMGELGPFMRGFLRRQRPTDD